MLDRHLIFLDIDNTQVPTSNQMVRPGPELPYTYLLKIEAEENGLPLVHCSGRSMPHIQRDMKIAQPGLREPHLACTRTVIANVGTEIWEWDDFTNQYMLLDEHIDCEAKSFFVQHAANIQLLLKNLSTLTIQEPDHLGPYKISFWGHKNVDGKKLADDVLECLNVLGVNENNVTLTLSLQSKPAIDITPQGVTKGDAIRYLAEKQGIPPSRVIVGGDSMNDLSMLSLPSVRAILPGNAQRELVEELKKLKPAQDVFFAEGAYAKGIFEGLVHFGAMQAVPEVPEDLAYLSTWKPPERRTPKGLTPSLATPPDAVPR